MNHNHPAQTDDARGTLWESLVDSGQCAVAERPAERTLDASIAAAIREEYFAEAGELAMRYGIGVCDVIEHLERAGLARMPRPERALEHIKCAVHASALAKGVAQAWADLITALGPGFDRACAGRLDPVEGIAFARRFWLDLRASTLESGLESGDRTNTGSRRRRREIRRPRGVRAPDLRTFAATRPMRYWLAERLLGSLETELGRAASAAERLDTVEEVRTLRIPAPMAAGAETRQG
jgi:hypothetical protein